MLDSGIDLVVGDVTVHDVWVKVLDNCHPDVIIHLAAETGTGQSLTEATRHSHVNVSGTTVMLDALVKYGVVPNQFVLASSRAVYGEGKWLNKNTQNAFYPGQRTRSQLSQHLWDFSESEPLFMQAASTRPHPVSVYGATKLAQESILRSWCTSFGANLAVLRLQNVYGPGQSLNNSYTGIVPLFCQMAQRGTSIPLYEDGQMKRDFVFIEDVATAILATIDNEAVSNVVLDVGSGTPLAIQNLAAVISEIYSAPSPHITAQFRFGDVRHAFCDISYTTEKLRWTPQCSLRRGLKELCVWLDEESKEKVVIL